MGICVGLYSSSTATEYEVRHGILYFVLPARYGFDWCVTDGSDLRERSVRVVAGNTAVILGGRDHTITLQQNNAVPFNIAVPFDGLTGQYSNPPKLPAVLLLLHFAFV